MSWHGWNGGACPTALGNLVYVLYRGYPGVVTGPVKAMGVCWKKEGSPLDVVAWREASATPDNAPKSPTAYTGHHVGRRAHKTTRPDYVDNVAHPKHYCEHPSGIECIQITEHMGFNLGNAVKYIWRCDLKKDAIEDLKKAKWYIEREISKREAK